MAKRLNKCAVCGKEYDVCSTCTKIKSFTPWRTIVDNINCYKIHIALRDYTNGYIDKDKVKELLSELDLSEVNDFQDNIKAAITDIMSEPAPKKKTKKTKTVEPEEVNADENNIEQ